MSKVLEEVLAANAPYASDVGARGKLALPTARRFATLTRMGATEIRTATPIGGARL